MKKKILLIILVLFLCASSGLFAISITYGNAHQNVDLSSIYNCVAPHVETSSEGQVEINSSSNQRIAIISDISITDSDNSITISSDCNYKHKDNNQSVQSVRPFGIDAVLYLEYENGNSVLAGYGGIGNDHNGGNYNVKSGELVLNISEELLIGDGFSQMTAKELCEYIYDNREMWLYSAYLHWEFYFNSGKVFEYGLKYGIYAAYGFMLDEYLKQTPTGARLELYLVLPSLGNKENQMLYAGNNEYSSTISVTGNGVNEKITISGNYTDVTERIECSLTVASNGNADAINLNSMDSANSEIAIGTYEYNIGITSLNQNVGFYAFLSSSNNPAVSGGEFTLSNDNYSFTYKAGISKGNGLEGEINWYDGAMTFSDVQDDQSNIMFNLGVSDYLTNGATRSFRGDGEILFRLTDKTIENFDSILPGTYTSTIYFHVVANL